MSVTMAVYRQPIVPLPGNWPGTARCWYDPRATLSDRLDAQQVIFRECGEATRHE